MLPSDPDVVVLVAVEQVLASLDAALWWERDVSTKRGALEARHYPAPGLVIRRRRRVAAVELSPDSPLS